MTAHITQLISRTGSFYFLLFYSTHFFHESSCGDGEPLKGSEPLSSDSSSSYQRSYNELRGAPSSSSDLSMNEIPRLPVWNGAGATHGDGQRQIDFTQLFELMGEPRRSRGRELSELITRPRPKCNRRIRILNGVTRIRERGSLARFQCSHGYTLIGPTTVVCLRERWSEDPPICVRSGCRPLRKPENGEMRQSIGGAVAAFYCSPNAELLGNPVIFCDGSKWNGSEPICHVELPPTTPATASTTSSLDDDIESELGWDTNLDRSQTVYDDPNLPNNISGAISESTISSDGESSTESTQTESGLIHFSTVAAAIEPGDDQSNSTAIKESAEQHNHPNATESEKGGGVLANSSTAPHQALEITTTRTISGQNETTLPLPLPPAVVVSATFASITIKAVMMATSPAPPEFQQSINDSQSSIVSFTSASQRSQSTATEANSDYDSDNQTSTFRTVIPTLPTTTRRFKILTKRPRPSRYTRKPGKRPIRRRTTTTTMKPRIPRLPPRKQGSKVTFKPRPIISDLSTSPPSSFLVPVPGGSQQISEGGSADYAIAIDKEFLPREHVAPIRPVEIKPDMLNINVSSRFGTGSRAEESHQLAHSSIISGIVFFVFGLATFSAGVVLYCWRKNKGIARARPYDMDGRTLSLHDDANDDFMWLEQNQRDNSTL